VPRFKLGQRHHVNCVPRAPFQKRSFRPLAGAQLTPDTQQRVHHNAPKGRIAWIIHPVHALFHRAILDARRRPGASRAALIDHSQDVRLPLALGRRPFRHRRGLLHLSRFELRNRRCPQFRHVSPWKQRICRTAARVILRADCWHQQQETLFSPLHRILPDAFSAVNAAFPLRPPFRAGKRRAAAISDLLSSDDSNARRRLNSSPRLVRALR